MIPVVVPVYDTNTSPWFFLRYDDETHLVRYEPDFLKSYKSSEGRDGYLRKHGTVFDRLLPYLILNNGDVEVVSIHNKPRPIKLMYKQGGYLIITPDLSKEQVYTAIQNQLLCDSRNFNDISKLAEHWSHHGRRKDKTVSKKELEPMLKYHDLIQWSFWNSEYGSGHFSFKKGQHQHRLVCKDLKNALSFPKIVEKKRDSLYFGTVESSPFDFINYQYDFYEYVPVKYYEYVPVKYSERTLAMFEPERIVDEIVSVDGFTTYVSLQNPSHIFQYDNDV